MEVGCIYRHQRKNQISLLLSICYYTSFPYQVSAWCGNFLFAVNRRCLRGVFSASTGAGWNPAFVSVQLRSDAARFAFRGVPTRRFFTFVSICIWALLVLYWLVFGSKSSAGVEMRKKIKSLTARISAVYGYSSAGCGFGTRESPNRNRMSASRGIGLTGWFNRGILV